MKMSNVQIDVLQEIGNIGVGNAATALANLLGVKVDIGVPRAEFLSLDEAIERLGGMEKMVVCVNLQVGGDVSATVLYLFEEESALGLVDQLMGLQPGTTKSLDDMGSSVVMEIGNILTGSFNGAIATLTGLHLEPSVPLLAYDMLGALFATSIAASGYVEDQVLCIQTSFSGERARQQVDSHFIMLPEVESLMRLFDALGVKIES